MVLQTTNTAPAHHETMLQDPLRGHGRSVEDAAVAVHLQPGARRPEGTTYNLIT